MAYTNVWSTTVPDGSTLPARQLDDHIRQLRLDLEERLEDMLGQAFADPMVDGSTVKDLKTLTTAVGTLDTNKATINTTTNYLAKKSGAGTLGDSDLHEATTGVLTLATRFLTLPAQPRCAIYRSSPTGSQNATYAIPFDAQQMNVGSMHDIVTNNSRVTIPSNGAGLYLLTATVLPNGAAWNSQWFQFLKNGSAIGPYFVAPPSVNGGNMAFTWMLQLAAADYVGVGLTNGSVDINFATFCVAKIA